MEMILVLILCIILAFTLAVIAITNLFEHLKSNGSTKMAKGFQANFSLVPIENKKSEDSMQVPPPQNDKFD